MLLCNEALSRDVLNALTARIAVLDERGIIVDVNDAWSRFASDHGAAGERFFVGDDYLAVCEKALASGDDGVLAEIIERLRSLLAGTGDELAVEYPCDAPEGRMWFLLRATRLGGTSAVGVVIAHEDITEAKRIEQTLRNTDRMLTSVLEALPVGVWVMDRSGRIVHGNPASVAIWRGARYVGPEQFGEYRGWWLSTGRRIAPDEWAAARAIRNGETSIGEEIEIECFDGTRRIILNSAIPLFGEGRIEGAIIVNEDITARKRDEAELRRASEQVEAASRDLAQVLERERVLSRIDPLTDTLNRRHFFDLAAQEISVAMRYRQPLALLLFDIDDFKRINDTLGHQAGDEVLKRVARIGRGHLRDADIFARYGGDEFVILLPHTTAAEAAVVAERMRNDIESQSEMTISSGVAELVPHDNTLDALIHRADVALYEAKDQGRNRTAVAR
ncbi:MAG: diguanylate cyclase [Thermoanaerobaculia bacterium]